MNTIWIAIFDSICGVTIWIAIFDSICGASQVAQVVKNLPANAGAAGSIPGSGRSPGGGNDNPFQYSCWDNPMEEPGGLQFMGLQRVGYD